MKRKKKIKKLKKKIKSLEFEIAYLNSESQAKSETIDKLFYEIKVKREVRDD